jgi:pimeloyl-ACP methyl ester carboxylesterase
MSRANAIRALSLLVSTMFLDVCAPAFAGGRSAIMAIRINAVELSCPIPYRTGRVPVVFIHGMLGSPDNWSAMIEQLSADPAVSAHYQPLVFRYDSLRSISDSGRDLLDALREAQRQFDPDGRDAAFDRVILVGHSMGGLVAKAAIRARGSGSSTGDGTRRGDEAKLLTPRLARVVFVATPHRGSPVDRGALRSTGSWIARAISPSTPAWAARQTSVDQLAWDNPLLDDLEQARAAEGVPFHSIIAALGDPTDNAASDGLVPVVSARLDGARSEVVVRTHHICYRHPDVIREVRRILIERAATSARPRRGGQAVERPFPTQETAP